MIKIWSNQEGRKNSILIDPERIYKINMQALLSEHDIEMYCVTLSKLQWIK